MVCHSHNFIHSKVSIHTTCKNLICCQTSLNMGVEERNIVLQLVLQVESFSCLFYSSLKRNRAHTWIQKPLAASRNKVKMAWTSPFFEPYRTSYNYIKDVKLIHYLLVCCITHLLKPHLEQRIQIKLSSQYFNHLGLNRAYPHANLITFKQTLQISKPFFLSELVRTKNAHKA